MNMIRSLAIFLSIVFISVVLFGFSASMPMDSDGYMSGCPFMNRTAVLCPMTILDHIRAWTFAFSAPLITFVSLLIFSFVFVIARINLKNSELKLWLKMLIRTRANSNLFLSNALQLAFSQGILHPRLYA